jgi:hypothetical protein
MREDGGLTAKIPIEAQIEAVRLSALIVRAGAGQNGDAPTLARAEALEAAHRTLQWVRDNVDALRQVASAAKPAPKPASPSADSHAESPGDARDRERRSFSSLGFAQQAALRGNDARFWRFLVVVHGEPVSDADSSAVAVRKLCAVISRKDFDASPAAAARWQSLDARFCEWLQSAPYDGEGRE